MDGDTPTLEGVFTKVNPSRSVRRKNHVHMEGDNGRELTKYTRSYPQTIPSLREDERPMPP